MFKNILHLLYFFFEFVFSFKYCIVFFKLCQCVRVTSIRVIYLISLTKSHTKFLSYVKMVFQIWFSKNMFQCKLLRNIKGVTVFLTDPRIYYCKQIAAINNEEFE